MDKIRKTAVFRAQKQQKTKRITLNLGPRAVSEHQTPKSLQKPAELLYWILMPAKLYVFIPLQKNNQDYSNNFVFFIIWFSNICSISRWKLSFKKQINVVNLDISKFQIKSIHKSKNLK